MSGSVYDIQNNSNFAQFAYYGESVTKIDDVSLFGSPLMPSSSSIHVKLNCDVPKAPLVIKYSFGRPNWISSTNVVVTWFMTCLFVLIMESKVDRL